MDRGERLWQAAKRLRRETRENKNLTRRDRDVRREAAARLEAMSRDHDKNMARWEAMDDPAVLEHQRRRVGRALTEVEDRAAIRKAVAEPVERRNPALLALSRSDEDRVREQAWAETDGPIEGWMNA
jgi:hypothetical protein